MLDAVEAVAHDAEVDDGGVQPVVQALHVEGLLKGVGVEGAGLLVGGADDVGEGLAVLDLALGVDGDDGAADLLQQALDVGAVEGVAHSFM